MTMTLSVKVFRLYNRQDLIKDTVLKEDRTEEAALSLIIPDYGGGATSSRFIVQRATKTVGPPGNIGRSIGRNGSTRSNTVGNR